MLFWTLFLSFLPWSENSTTFNISKFQYFGLGFFEEVLGGGVLNVDFCESIMRRVVASIVAIIGVLNYDIRS